MQSLSPAASPVADALGGRVTVGRMNDWHFLVDRDDYRRTRTVDATPAELVDGQARLRVDAFGFTANNVTYAAAGDMVGYWTFFPVPDTDDGVNWGRVPVWGFAVVVESRADGVAEGERLFGYLPMSTELVIEPTQVGHGSLTDGSAHRAALPPVYNSYARCVGDPMYDADHEAAQMIYRPLFFTSFLIADMLDAEDCFGASTVVLTSASSKTAFGTAHLLHGRPGVEVVGLTSAGNRGFVEDLGCYDRVLTYDEAGELPDGPAVLVDMSGNAGVVRAVHERYGDDLMHSAIVGLTHWEDRMPTSGDPLPGPAQTFFFAPARIEQRRQDWGPGEVEKRLGAAWAPFVEWVSNKVRVEERSGPGAVAEVYADQVEGRTRPDVAPVLRP